MSAYYSEAEIEQIRHHRRIDQEAARAAVKRAGITVDPRIETMRERLRQYPVATACLLSAKPEQGGGR